MGCIAYITTNTRAVPLVRREDVHHGRVFYCLDGVAAKESVS